MDDRLYIGKVHILEWLRPSDVNKTGRDLHAVVQPIAAAAHPPVEVTFWSIATKAECLEWLRGVERDFIATGKLPLLQIETHGDEEGIGLSQTNGFDWPELN